MMPRSADFSRMNSLPFCETRFRQVEATSSRQVLEIDRTQRYFDIVGLDLGHVQDVRDQRQQMPAGVVDGFQIGLVRGICVRLDVLQQNLAVADDGIERRAKLVVHLGKKDRLGLIGAIGLIFGLLQLGRGREDAFRFPGAAQTARS